VGEARKERKTATVMNKSWQSENVVGNNDTVKGRRAKEKIRKKRKYEEQEKERNKDKREKRKGIQKNKRKRWDGAKRKKQIYKNIEYITKR